MYYLHILEQQIQWNILINTRFFTFVGYMSRVHNLDGFITLLIMTTTTGVFLVNIASYNVIILLRKVLQ